MWSIRFKSFMESRLTFDRLFTKTAASPEQAKLFEAVAEALMDAALEYAALQAQAQKNDAGQVELLTQLRDFPNTYVKARHQTIPRNKLEWLRLSVEDYVHLTRHKVIGK